MAYDRVLADRLRECLAGERTLTEKAMFGGLAFLLDGHLTVAANSHGGLLLRVDPADTDTLVRPPQVDRMVMRGKEMEGWLRVDAEAVASEEDLQRWVDHGVRFARTLPAK